MPAWVETDAPVVLIVADDPRLVERCRAALEPSDLRVLLSCSGASQRPPEVIIVSDHHAAAAEHRAPVGAASIPPSIVAVGEGHPAADVALPLDFLPRELLAVCRLLAENCRLRRQLAEGQLTGTRLRQEAYRDPLTQLPNRRAWEAELALRWAPGAATPLCLAIVDVDHLKQVNDGWGHAAGDQLLVATGTALRQSLRQDDFVARLAGDEFGLLLAGLEADAAAGVLQRVHARLPAQIAATSRQVTSVSIGYACWPVGGRMDGSLLLCAADQALRQAKRQGRNQVVAGAVKGD